jgi:hypothetical protein
MARARLRLGRHRIIHKLSDRPAWGYVDQPPFRQVDQAGTIDTLYASPSETDQPIYVLRGAKIPLERMWPGVKNYR